MFSNLLDVLMEESNIMNAYCNNDAILASGGYDHTVKLWQTYTGVCYWTGQHADSQVNALCITPDKQKLASAGYQNVRLYDLNSTNNNPTVNYEGITKNVTSVGFQEEGKWMFTTGEDCSVRIWDLRCKNVQCNRIFQSNASINFAVLHPNQVEIIFGDDNGLVHFMNLKTDRTEQLKPDTEASILCVSIDSYGKCVAAVNNLGHCYIWNLSHDSQSGVLMLKPKHQILSHSRQVLKCKFSPDSALLITTSADQSARIWKTDDFSLYRELKCSVGQRWVWDAAFTNDSQYVITGSSDGLARLWSVENAEVKIEYSGHQKAVTALAFADVAAS